MVEALPAARGVFVEASATVPVGVAVPLNATATVAAAATTTRLGPTIAFIIATARRGSWGVDGVGLSINSLLTVGRICPRKVTPGAPITRDEHVTGSTARPRMSSPLTEAEFAPPARSRGRYSIEASMLATSCNDALNVFWSAALKSTKAPRWVEELNSVTHVP
jgi:hypothetical protein